MINVIIIGASAAGRMVSWILSQEPNYSIAGFADQDQSKWGETINGLTVLGPDTDLIRYFDEGITHAVVAIGNPDIRARVHERLEKSDIKLTRAIHPDSYIAPDVQIGEGVIVLPGCTLADNPVIGDNTFVGQGAVIAHDTIIGNDCLIGGCSSIGAEVNVSDRVLIGWGSVVGPRFNIGSDSAIATGSTVVSDIPDKAVVVGNPARIIKYRD